MGDFAIGSSSITSFGLRTGFLYYPQVTAATLNTATAGGAPGALSWSVATAYQGWNIGGYNVCHKSTGSYTCTDVGNVTSSTKTGLTNGTTYTFKIQAYDNSGSSNIIAESNEKTSAPVAAATPTPTPSSGGGGGGGGSTTISTGTVIVKGIAYSQSTVAILIDGTQTTIGTADKNANFESIIKNVSSGPRAVSLYTTDSNGRRSITITFNISLNPNTTVTLEGILMPTTIDISAIQINRGEILRIFGQAAPLAVVNIHVQSEEIITKANTDSL